MNQNFKIAAIILIIFPFFKIQKLINKNWTSIISLNLFLKKLMVIFLELTSWDSYLQYKAFVAQFCQLVMFFYPLIWIFLIYVINGLFFLGGGGGGELYSCAITFSESSECILGVVGIKYGQDFIFPVLQ